MPTTQPSAARQKALIRPGADPLVGPVEAAEMLAVAPATLAAWRSTNRQPLPFVKMGGRVRYRMSDLQAFIAAHVRNPGHPPVTCLGCGDA